MPALNLNAAGLISLLGERNVDVQVFALNGLLKCVDVDWPVVAEAVGAMYVSLPSNCCDFKLHL